MDKIQSDTYPGYSESIERTSSILSYAIKSSLTESMSSVVDSILRMNEASSRIMGEAISDAVKSFAELTSLSSSHAICAVAESVRVLNDYVFQRNTDFIELRAECPDEKRNFAERIERIASKYQVSLGLLVGLIAVLVTIVFEVTPDKEIEEIKNNQQTIIANQEVELAQNEEVIAQNEKIIELLTEIRDNGEYSELDLKDFLKHLEDTLNVGVEAVGDSQDAAVDFKDVSDQVVDAHDLCPHSTMPDREAKQPTENSEENPSQ